MAFVYTSMHQGSLLAVDITAVQADMCGQLSLGGREGLPKSWRRILFGKPLDHDRLICALHLRKQDRSASDCILPG